MTNWNNNEINLAAIKKLYANNRTARAAFDYFASRQRNQSETKVDRLQTILVRRGCDVSYAKVRDFLRELGRLNCGEYKIGRRGWQSRLRWNVGVISLGQVAAGQRSQVEELTEEEVKNEKDDIDESFNGAVGLDDMKVTYPLRRDRNVDLVLPRDVTPGETQRLADFIRTLQFD